MKTQFISMFPKWSLVLALLSVLLPWHGPAVSDDEYHRSDRSFRFDEYYSSRMERKALRRLKEIVEKGQDLNAVGDLGETELTQASKKGQPAVVKFLIEKGVDVNARDRLGWTPLQKALDHGSSKEFQWLVFLFNWTDANAAKCGWSHVEPNLDKRHEEIAV